MLRKKPPSINHNNKGRCSILRVAALLIILCGIWMVSVNLYHFTRSTLSGWLYEPGKYTEDSNPADNASEDITSEDIASKDTAAEDTDAAVNQPAADAVTEAPDTGANILGTAGPNAKKELYPELPEEGEVIGELSIPKIDAAYPIYEGTEENELDLGVGHYINSVLPGEIDNCVLSGHRNTVFDQLGEIEKGDSLIVTTSAGTFEYLVQKIRIVEEDDETVIVPKPKATLTVTTCYPFTYVGAAPQRYILVAGLKKAELNKPNQ